MNGLQIKGNITTLELFEEEINEGKISAVEYKDKKGEARPMFNLTLSQAKQVLVRESKAVRKAVIKHIEELENKLKLPSTYKEALLELVKREEEKEQLQLTIKLQEPKVIFSDAVNASEDSILMGQLSNILKQNGIDIGRTRLFKYLRDNNYLIKRGEDKNLPTNSAIARGLFEIKKTNIGNPDKIRTISTPKVTGKGQIYFINKFLKGKDRGLEVI